MGNMGVTDYLFLYSIICIWLILFVNIILSIFGYVYYLKVLKMDVDKSLEEYPMVSILVPAHNEEKVIEKTVRALLSLNYPKSCMEVIVINDNSSDNTKLLLDRLKKEYIHMKLTVINTDSVIGGKGKSNALNIGFSKSCGKYIAVYDADNTPERNALKYLIHTIERDESLGAVIGKFRTRNKERNLLTKFINIETLSFQWMAQAGRWEMLKLCTIPGTNFVIRRSIIEAIGGWDIKAVAEDTEVSFRVYKAGYKIQFMPISVTWEQEPETLKVWFKQRTRWVKGNIYVLIKNLKNVFSKDSRNIRFDLMYYFLTYFFFLSSVVLSDLIFLLNVLGLIQIHVGGNMFVLWILAYIMFILQVAIAVATEKGEINTKNIIIISVMYFTYCQLWIVVALIGFYNYFKDKIFKSEIKWYKTERF